MIVALYLIQAIIVTIAVSCALGGGYFMYMIAQNPEDKTSNKERQECAIGLAVGCAVCFVANLLVCAIVLTA